MCVCMCVCVCVCVCVFIDCSTSENQASDYLVLESNAFLKRFRVSNFHNALVYHNVLLR